MVIDRAGALPPPATRAAAPPAARIVRARWLVPDSIAYIRIASFGRAEFQREALALVDSFKAARALIVDVRGNGGGSSPVALTRALMDRPYRWWQEASTLRLNPVTLLPKRRAPGTRGRPGQPRRLRTVRVVGPATVYGGPLVILADAGCASACEDFVMPFKMSGRAVVVGDTTEGTTGQPHVHAFPNGLRVAVGAKRAYFPDGAPFEGVGIAPDVPVPVRAADLAAGRDAARERALEVARCRASGVGC